MQKRMNKMNNPVINSWAESGVLKQRNQPTVKGSRNAGQKLHSWVNSYVPQYVLWTTS